MASQIGSSDVTDEEVKKDLRDFFQNDDHWVYDYGSPSSDCGPDYPFHMMQLRVLFEDRYFHWITGRNADDLISEGFLKDVSKQGTKFLVRSDIRYYKHKRNRWLKLIGKYSDESKTKGRGNYAEILFRHMFERNGFEVRGREENEYEGKKWTKTNHDLDFIIEKDSISYGVEVKNRLRYMKNEQFETKLEMCDHLDLVPLWILRNTHDNQIDEIEANNGFILVFKTWIHPSGERPMVDSIWNKMRLPVSIRRKVPEKVEQKFLEQHRNRLS